MKHILDLLSAVRGRSNAPILLGILLLVPLSGCIGGAQDPVDDLTTRDAPQLEYEFQCDEEFAAHGEGCARLIGQPNTAYLQPEAVLDPTDHDHYIMVAHERSEPPQVIQLADGTVALQSYTVSLMETFDGGHTFNTMAAPLPLLHNPWGLPGTSLAVLIFLQFTQDGALHLTGTAIFSNTVVENLVGMGVTTDTTHVIRGFSATRLPDNTEWPEPQFVEAGKGSMNKFVFNGPAALRAEVACTSSDCYDEWIDLPTDTKYWAWDQDDLEWRPVETNVHILQGCSYSGVEWIHVTGDEWLTFCDYQPPGDGSGPGGHLTERTVVSIHAVMDDGRFEVVDMVPFAPEGCGGAWPLHLFRHPDHPGILAPILHPACPQVPILTSTDGTTWEVLRQDLLGGVDLESHFVDGPDESMNATSPRRWGFDDAGRLHLVYHERVEADQGQVGGTLPGDEWSRRRYYVVDLDGDIVLEAWLEPPQDRSVLPRGSHAPTVMRDNWLGGNEDRLAIGAEAVFTVPEADGIRVWQIAPSEPSVPDQ